MSDKRKPPAGCYWRGNTLWARFTVRGVEYRHSLRTGDAKLAKQRRKASREQIVARQHFGDDRKTYLEAFLGWAEWVKTQVGQKTAERYAVSLGQLEIYIKTKFQDQIDTALVGEIVDGRRATGVTNATIKRDLTALSSVMDYSVDEGFREDNPVLTWLQSKGRRRTRLRERRDPIVLPDHRDIAYIIGRCPGNFARMVEAALRTGCRQRELQTAPRRAVDHERRQMQLLGKRNKIRVLDLSPAAYAGLKAIPTKIGCEWLFWHDNTDDGRGDLYRRVSSRFSEIVREAAKAAKAEGREFRPFTFHHLRHRFAVDYLKDRVGSIYDLKKHLGHAKVSTTEIYLEYLTPDEARDAMFARGEAVDARSAQRVGT